MLICVFGHQYGTKKIETLESNFSTCYFFKNIFVSFSQNKQVWQLINYIIVKNSHSRHFCNTEVSIINMKGEKIQLKEEKSGVRKILDSYFHFL